ncbi:Homoserine kinase [Talaromyces atroroseus]|uniref:Homoserine kinase n=1 Tax=Talaromyces atroroseus TaxID=1441469 RepID=A0A225ALG5_TALAT|nr:Homoserine kinase [Talaromyces atroroseus]OKL62382.1 Homoserine kinase [Talaromyces atroroseus]
MASSSSFTIRIPCSSANIGPGFDVIGLALSLYLEVHVTIDPSSAQKQPLNCAITYENLSASKEQISLDPEVNLITRVALYVLRCHDQRAFPVNTHVHIKNPIPLGRGLGTSGTAVVAGVVLGNELGKLGLSKGRLLDYCLMIERHPDNVAASLFGGFVGTYLSELKPEDIARIEIPLSEVLPEPAGGIDTGKQPPKPPVGIGHCTKFPWAKEIKAIAIIPDFVVPTANARNVLPKQYSRPDVVFNLQRVALLPIALGTSPPDPDMIYLAMQDRVHQPYRQTLIPGLIEILQSMTPATQPGLLGICLSGAGPTILALATDRFDEIATKIVGRFTERGIECQWKLLELAREGTLVEHH